MPTGILYSNQGLNGFINLDDGTGRFVPFGVNEPLAIPEGSRVEFEIDEILPQRAKNIRAIGPPPPAPAPPREKSPARRPARRAEAEPRGRIVPRRMTARQRYAALFEIYQLDGLDRAAAAAAVAREFPDVQRAAIAEANAEAAERRR